MRFALGPWLDGSAPAVLGEGEALSRATLLRRANGIAEVLKDLAPPLTGSRRDTSDAQRVVIACRSRANFAAALLGAWQAGLGVELLPNLEHEVTWLARLRDDPELSVWLHDHEGGGDGLYVPKLSLGDTTELREIDGDETLLTLHTSGTTKRAERYQKSARSVLGEVVALAREFESMQKQAALCMVPSTHLFGLLFGVLLPLCVGASLVDAEVLLPSDVSAALRTHKARFLVSTPSHLRALLDGIDDWPTGTQIISSGAKLPAPLFAALRARDLLVCDVLGSTETGGIATRRDERARWRPLPGVTVKASGEQLSIDSPWSTVSSSADRIAVWDDGSFEHLGRAGDVVKIAGKRVDMRRVEAALLEIPGVTDAAVIAREDSRRGSRLAAVVATPRSPQEVREALLTEFDPVLVPRPIVVVDALPRSATGKLTRAQLLALLVPQRQQRTVELSPEHPAFAGHFPGQPVFPGAALVALVASEIRGAWPDLNALEQLSRIRFMRALLPGDRLEISLVREQPSAGVIRYSVQSGEREAANGKLTFRASAVPTDDDADGLQ